MKILEVSPPAKINLILRVLQRRRGPLHHVHGVMLTVGWHDELTVKKKVRPGIDLRVEGGPRVAAPANLAFRAAEAVVKAEGLRDGVSLFLKKRIPDGAGLGGGSSDAAAVLLGMVRLWGLKWPDRRVARVALTLGSDVPFFLWGGLAEVHGVGEVVKPLVPLPSQAIGLITFPSIRISTAWAFRRLDRENTRVAGLTKGRTAIKLFQRCQRVSNNPWSEFYAHNDFSEGVRARYPQVNAVWTWLERQGQGSVGLSGKGPTLFMFGTSSNLRRMGLELSRRFASARFRVVSPVRVEHALR